MEEQQGAPAGRRCLKELQEAVPWTRGAPRFGPLASAAGLVTIQGISTFFGPTGRNSQRTRWLLKMQDFTEGTAVSFIPRVGAGDSSSLKVSPVLVLEVGTARCQRPVLRALGRQPSQQPPGITALGRRLQSGSHSRVPDPSACTREDTRGVPKTTHPPPPEGLTNFGAAQVDGARRRFFLPSERNTCNHERGVSVGEMATPFLGVQPGVSRPRSRSYRGRRGGNNAVPPATRVRGHTPPAPGRGGDPGAASRRGHVSAGPREAAAGRPSGLGGVCGGGGVGGFRLGPDPPRRRPHVWPREPGRGGGQAAEMSVSVAAGNLPMRLLRRKIHKRNLKLRQRNLKLREAEGAGTPGPGPGPGGRADPLPG